MRNDVFVIPSSASRQEMEIRIAYNRRGGEDPFIVYILTNIL